MFSSFNSNCSIEKHSACSSNKILLNKAMISYTANFSGLQVFLASRQDQYLAQLMSMQLHVQLQNRAKIQKQPQEQCLTDLYHKWIEHHISLFFCLNQNIHCHLKKIIMKIKNLHHIEAYIQKEEFI